VAKATKNKKSEVARHVGLDFYDLVIEALIDRLSFRCLEHLQLRTIDFGVTNPAVSLGDIPGRESYHIL
jgi:hypothetical protein